MKVCYIRTAPTYESARERLLRGRNGEEIPCTTHPEHIELKTSASHQVLRRLLCSVRRIDSQYQPDQDVMARRGRACGLWYRGSETRNSLTLRLSQRCSSRLHIPSSWARDTRYRLSERFNSRCARDPSEIITSNIDGLLVRRGTFASWRQSLMHLLEELRLRKKLVSVALDMVRGRVDVSNVDLGFLEYIEAQQ